MNGRRKEFKKDLTNLRDDKEGVQFSVLLDDEDDLSEVQPDAVPDEVRQWLATTFTKNQPTTKRRSKDKPKFRSVANAIRAGNMVDKIYRSLCGTASIQIPTHIADVLKGVDNWSFDVFALNEAASDQVLKYVGYELLNRYGLVNKFKIPQNSLDNFLLQMDIGYIKYRNPYHNNLHAADVTQTVHYILCHLGFALADIHDFQHTGTTNNFHVMSGSATAILYNDRAVLENFHISAAFKVILEEDANILKNLSKEEYREFRNLVIEMVLATDMSSHFQQLKTMKSLLSHNELDVDKAKAMSLILHCCDISHPSKQYDIHSKWTGLLIEEFFRQGDKEKELGLPYSPLCDRYSTLVAESQIGFIDFIVAPSMEVRGELLDKVYLHNIGEQQAQREASLSSESKARPKSLSSMKAGGRVMSVDSASDAALSSRSITSAPATNSSRHFKGNSLLHRNVKDGKIRRPWTSCLDENRRNWQERAVQDAKMRAEKSTQSVVVAGAATTTSLAPPLPPPGTPLGSATRNEKEKQSLTGSPESEL